MHEQFSPGPNGVIARSRRRRGIPAIGLLTGLVAVAASVILPTASADAAVSGAIYEVTLTRTTLGTGSTGDVCVSWSFPAGSAAGDTTTVAAATDFLLRPNIAFPAGQPIYDEDNEVHIATVRLVDGAIEVTREVDASWGDIASVAQACLPFTFTGSLGADVARDTAWIANNDTHVVPIIGASAPTNPAWYGPSKSGRFAYSAQGEPIIEWTFKSPIGYAAAGDVTISDLLGPGQELRCDSIRGTVRWWDQSFSAGRDRLHDFIRWQDGSFQCDDIGFSGVTGFDIPAPLPGGNTDIAEDGRPSEVAYVVLNYTSTVTDYSLAASGWTNTATWSVASTGASQDFPARVRMPGTATGNRALDVTKTVSGAVSQADGRVYDLTVDCTDSGASVAGYPQTVSLAVDESARLYAPIGSSCAVSEPDAQGAVATASAPVTITSGLTDRFALSVDNRYEPSGSLPEDDPEDSPATDPDPDAEPEADPGTPQEDDPVTDPAPDDPGAAVDRLPATGGSGTDAALFLGGSIALLLGTALVLISVRRQA